MCVEKFCKRGQCERCDQRRLIKKTRREEFEDSMGNCTKTETNSVSYLVTCRSWAITNFQSNESGVNNGIPEMFSTASSGTYNTR